MSSSINKKYSKNEGLCLNTTELRDTCEINYIEEEWLERKHYTHDEKKLLVQKHLLVEADYIDEDFIKKGENVIEYNFFEWVYSD